MNEDKKTRQQVAEGLAEVLGYVLSGISPSVTSFYSNKFRIKLTRRGKYDRRHKSMEIILTVGPPAFREKAYLKKMKGAEFPLLWVRKK